MIPPLSPHNEIESPAVISALRHRLRTPLNHITGYAEILLQEWISISPAAKSELGRICESARRILEALNALLPVSGPIRSLQPLREAIADPGAAIVRSIGNIAQETPAAHLMDLLRINIAAGELLAFSERNYPIEQLSILTPEARSATAPPAPLPGGHILVVDDDEANRDLLSRQLQRLGHTVVAAEDGSEALRQLGRKPFDLVLLDVVLPGMHGMAVLESIKRDPTFRNVAVIMISALDELNEAARCLEAGAEDYLMKPFEPVLLKARVGASLERKRFRDREQERSRELERANEELQQFAYILSHDLQEPLRTMGMYAQLLTRRWQERMDPDSEQFLNFIVDAARRMQGLVEDVLSFSRCTLTEERTISIDLKEILKKVLADLAVSIKETGAAISLGPLPVVIAGARDMTEMLQNLIGNAIKYHRPGIAPKVQVSSQRLDISWIISVADNGIGVPDDAKEQIFLPFIRLHGPEVSGNGIGLAVCRKIAEKYRGRIWVESAPEFGSIFRFALPVAKGPP